MRKIIILCFILTICLCACKAQDENIIREISESELYSEADINEAMDFLTLYFKENSSGCTLKKIIYDEKYSQSVSEPYINETGIEETIVLTIVYDIEELASNGDLIPKQENITNNWVLSRFNNEWGYSGEPNVYKPGINEWSLPPKDITVK